MGKAVSRNDPCPCGSGKKYKQCCLGKTPREVKRRKFLIPAILALGGVVFGVVLGAQQGPGTGLAAAGIVLVVAALVFIIRDPPPPKSGKGKHPASINFGK